MNKNELLLLKNFSLLFVEDNEKILKEVTNIFGNMFSSVYTAKDGVEALDIFNENKIDIIITDINMPNMNGINFMKKVRKIDKKTAIIVLTAYSDKDILLEVANLQIDGYIIKPINSSKIFSALSNAMQRIDSQLIYNFQNGLKYDINTKTVFNSSNKESLILGKKEAKLLELLIHNSHRVVSKEEIILNIWEIEDITASALKNLLMNLRTKVGKDTIKNFAGQGWKINLN
jgi:two-component system response regulator VanR